MTRTILVWTAGVAVVLLGGCSPQSPVAIGGKPGSESSTTGSGSSVTPHPVTEDKEFKSDQGKKATPVKIVPDKPLSKKLDPAVFGEYRLVLSDVQNTQIAGAIQRLEKDAQEGKEGAAAALEMARAAKELAEELVIVLKPNGRYSANLGTGDTGGSFRTGEGIVLLRPDAQPSDPNAPKDMELQFDKSAKSLTVEFQGEKMLFERKS